MPPEAAVDVITPIAAATAYCSPRRLGLPVGGEFN
jgi:hypothetical protein